MLQTDYQDDILVKNYSHQIIKCHGKYIYELSIIKAGDEYLRLINLILINVGQYVISQKSNNLFDFA